MAKIEPFALPHMELIDASEPTKNQRSRDGLISYTGEGLELKVITNALFLLTMDDSHFEACKKFADCLADAIGLNVDFEAILI